MKTIRAKFEFYIEVDEEEAAFLLSEDTGDDVNIAIWDYITAWDTGKNVNQGRPRSAVSYISHQVSEVY